MRIGFGGWLSADIYYNKVSVDIVELDTKIAIVESDIAQYNQVQEDARIVQNKISNVQELLEKHIYWSEFFNKLELYTISEVYYSSMSVDVNGTVTLTAVGSSYENAVKQLMVMERATDFVTEVTISDITFQDITLEAPAGQDIEIETITSDEQMVRFNINLTVLPEIFYYSKISL